MRNLDLLDVEGDSFIEKQNCSRYFISLLHPPFKLTCVVLLIRDTEVYTFLEFPSDARFSF